MKQEFNLRTPDDKGVVPLHAAVEDEGRYYFDTLLRFDSVKKYNVNGVYINSKNFSSASPLHLAAIDKDYYKLAILIRLGANTEEKVKLINSSSGVEIASMTAREIYENRNEEEIYDDIVKQTNDSCFLNQEVPSRRGSIKPVIYPSDKLYSSDGNIGYSRSHLR